MSAADQSEQSREARARETRRRMQEWAARPENARLLSKAIAAANADDDDAPEARAYMDELRERHEQRMEQRRQEKALLTALRAWWSAEQAFLKDGGAQSAEAADSALDNLKEACGQAWGGEQG